MQDSLHLAQVPRCLKEIRARACHIVVGVLVSEKELMSSSRQPTWRNALPACGVALVVSLIALFQASITIDGTRYFWLDDDQMISMRYARNLANGEGLVWNAG